MAVVATKVEMEHKKKSPQVLIPPIYGESDSDSDHDVLSPELRSNFETLRALSVLSQQKRAEELNLLESKKEQENEKTKSANYKSKNPQENNFSTLEKLQKNKRKRPPNSMENGSEEDDSDTAQHSTNRVRGKQLLLDDGSGDKNGNNGNNSDLTFSNPPKEKEDRDDNLNVSSVKLEECKNTRDKIMKDRVKLATRTFSTIQNEISFLLNGIHELENLLVAGSSSGLAEAGRGSGSENCSSSSNGLEHVDVMQAQNTENYLNHISTNENIVHSDVLSTSDSLSSLHNKCTSSKTVLDHVEAQTSS